MMIVIVMGFVIDIDTIRAAQVESEVPEYYASEKIERGKETDCRSLDLLEDVYANLVQQHYLALVINVITRTPVIKHAYPFIEAPGC